MAGPASNKRARAAQPAIGTMFRRALLLKCPQCGARKTFIKHWLGRYERCRSCGIRWHREHGFELGPMTLNVIVTFFTLAVVMIVSFVATAPDFPVNTLLAVCLGTAILVPLVVYPFTYTLWLAFDLAGRRPDATELDEGRAAVSNP